ncbi:protein croquemort-like [Orussus abietinus]|uniref:protein croquemort-like n=1 Tax=Orussus abietinus TaxID=222816 RepID=UPI0006255F73|nr:protein croquemort-like [Orussus abietinus]XP_023287572.1 protein croquemort-like [Orussus abietinus]
MRPWSDKSFVIAFLGLVLVVLGASCLFFWPLLFGAIIQQGLSLSPESRSFEIWRNTGQIPLHLEFYFFNWTNPEELKVPGTKPIVVQRGPYTFREERQKINITFHPENNTVSYLQRRFWYFDQSRSNGTLQDNITQLNVVAVSAVHKVRYWSYFMQNSLSFILSKFPALFVTKTVDELLFTGYEDPIINMGKLAASEEDIPPFDRFGWFYKRNGSTEFEGHYNMETGQDDIKNIGTLKYWNYRDTTKFYRSPCNTVEGSAGEFWPPGRTKDGDINLFSPDLCRTVTYEYVRTVTHQGIEGYQYAIGNKTLNNDTKRRFPHEQAKYFESTTLREDFFDTDYSGESTDPPEDPDVANIGQCYCNGECSPSGLMNITSCRFGAPGFVSLPHFYNADPMLLDQVVGLYPREENHSFYITLEPTTGIPIDVAARLQINILLQPSSTVTLFKDVPRIYFPMFWFNMRAGVTEDMALSLRYLLMFPSIGHYASGTMMILGSVILLALSIMYYLRKARVNHATVSRRSADPSEKKTELVYMDRRNSNDDYHTRRDRQLYPKL